MEENGKYCFGCLCTEDEYNLREFIIQCEPLKAIFQVDKLCLCYLCNRIAQHTEMFVQNVQNNQSLMDNFHGDITSIQSAGAQVRSSICLAHHQLSTIELNKTVMEDEELYSSSSSKELNIKLELKEELLEDYEEELIDDFQNVKEEDDFPLNTLLKEEIKMDSIDTRSVRKTLKSKKCKKAASKIKERVKKLLIDIPKKYTKLYVTEKQCKKEREQRAKGTAYLNSTYKCKKCVKGFMLKDSFDRHMAKHSPSRGRFCCKICSIRYDTASKLTKHKQIHTIRYKCSECDFTCSNYSTIKEHFSSKHNINNGYIELKCPHCPKIFTRAISLRKHQYYNHSGKDKVSCDICQNTYANKDSLRCHLMRKHPEASSEELVKLYECQECGQAFKAPSQLRNHRVKHSELRAFYCVECDRSFKTAAILAHHLKTAMPHIKYSELPLHCQHCDKRFAIKRDLVRHVNRVHLNIKPYPCDKCDRKYINSWSLLEHKRYKHDGAKRPLRYPCSMCDKVFDRNSILKSHMRTHTGERPYLCVRCPSAFAQPSALGTHVRLVHLRLARRPPAAPAPPNQ